MVRQMKVALCSLVLNEEEFLSRNYDQHKDWPGLISWIFIEAADPLYATANPGMVETNGSSTDCTRTILEKLRNKDRRVVYDQFGWMKTNNPAQAKTQGRDQYLNYLEDTRPDFFVVIDADEFYTYTDQQRINGLVADTNFLSYRLRQRHLWRPPSLGENGRFEYEAIGGYWAVPHVRVFRWQSGLRYRYDHNYPQGKNYHPLQNLYEGTKSDPECIHLGFTRERVNRVATNKYYQERGEGKGDGRDKYVSCRASWETWQPGETLPAGAKVVTYDGPVPECYK